VKDDIGGPGVLVLCAVLDAKIDLFEQVFAMRSNAEAIRMFADECKREGSRFQMHPEDFSLFRVGQFFVQTGQLTSELAPVNLATGRDFQGVRAVS